MAIRNGLSAYWNFNDDGSGGVSLVDVTGNGNDFTSQRDKTTLGAGIIGGCANFNGQEYFESGTLFSASSPFTYSAWIKSSTIGQGGVWGQIGANFGNGYRILAVDSNIYFQAPNTTVVNTTGVSYNDAAWHNVVGIFDGTNFSLYVDNVFIGSAAGNIGPSVPFYVNFSGDVGPLGTCSIDEVGAWSRALSTGEVNTLWNNGAGNTYPFQLYYNNAQEDGDWGNLLNWWQDSGFTIQAIALPYSTTIVNLYNQVTQNTQGANQCFCHDASFWSADFGVGLTLQSTGVVNMQGSSVMAGTIDGNVTMRDSSRAYGYIGGNAYVYYDQGNGQFPIGGTVAGTVSYLGWPAVSPQWFNDSPSVGGAGNGDFSNPANWWTDNTFTTRPINSVGTQALPDASTNIFIAPNGAIYSNTGTLNPTVNTLTADSAELAYIGLTVTNGATFSGDSWGMYESTIYGDVTFRSGAYNEHSVIHGHATYTSPTSLIYSFNVNSLQKITQGGQYGSNNLTVTIAGSGGGQDGLISRLLRFPWFLNF